MSLAQTIAPHLPYLRRFSRALCGAQASGDAYVATTLQAIIDEPSSISPNVDPQVALYTVFLKIWNSVPLNTESPRAYEYISQAERNLAALTPRSRQAFLLRAVEGFSLKDTAMILGIDEVQAKQLIDQAGREIATQVATDVLIIEDEPVIAMDLESLVEDLGHEVIGVATTHREAVAMAKTHRPGLVLADIQLADGSSGLDAVNEMLASFEVPVIFITAYPERLLTGEKPEPAFLITKPFQVDSVKAAISQALFFDRKASKAA